MNEKFINIKQLSDYLGLQEQTIRLWAIQKKIPFYKVGSRLRFRLSEIEQWIQGGGK